MRYVLEGSVRKMFARQQVLRKLFGLEETLKGVAVFVDVDRPAAIDVLNSPQERSAQRGK